ncbi:ligase-associated DNA damage response endonuclease PdeM [Zunongwangia sp. F363]|uniref:Ligase-associated DNA damage response endonuclease PdeM n=1 Tax=Autumnicola tepida TaxID=3075595 RepID=A0ABU3C6T8_9FLAO|nr:ligase-associated DNA damage response endonuclease PdeM [Zunongwangia sp. F363]MDT0642029.1 ligase-associated DNA damage response endonuclease PdeM [Zunongwangia sp. F363]
MTITIKNNNFELHPCGAAYWREQDMLLISDAHLGKISHFRKYGSAVPQNAISKNFEELDAVFNHFQPQKICFLGDLFHSSINFEWQLFENWTRALSSEVILIAGNHDVISPLKYEELGIRIFSEWHIHHFLLTHHPEEKDGFFNICGHIHPGFRLRGRGRQALKLRCFYKSPQQLILPAFGEFTGNYMMQPEKEDQIFAITKNEVILIA